MSSLNQPNIPDQVSIVICTRGRHELLLKTVTYLQYVIPQDKYLEIVIVEETNKPQPLQGKKIEYYSIPERGRGLGFTRNTGLEKARGSIIVFIDDDIFPSENWFGNLLNPFRDEQVGAVGGAVLPDLKEINTIGKCISLFGFPAGGFKRYARAKGLPYETNLLSTGNSAFRADLARSVGGFDELLRSGEDQEFFFRISSISKTLFVPEAIVFHRQRDSLARVLKWFIRRGKGELIRQSKRINPFLALILPLRGNFLLKVLGVTIICLFLLSNSPKASLLFFSLIYITWNTILWKREYSNVRKPLHDSTDRKLVEIQESIATNKVALSLPLVKFCMDIGREIGKILALCRYFYHRILCKPLILTFHHVKELPQRFPVSDPKYYCSKKTLEQILIDCEYADWWVLPLAEIIARLRDSPRSLYFEKILAITFDDAYASLYQVLTDLLSKQKYPFTIFVPTNLATVSKEQKRFPANMDEGIMSWDQIQRLHEMGVEIGSHTRNHLNLSELPKEKIIDEIKGSLADLEGILTTNRNNKFTFSYPYGSYNREIMRIVKEAGYFGAVANFHGNIRPRTDPWQIPRYTVFGDKDWTSIRTRSRSLWVKELLKDIRDFVFL